jgi:streptogramin lyase
VGIAAVDAASGDVTESASLPGTEPHELLDAAAALERSGLSPDRRAQLVWRPSAASRSPLYPLWQIGDGGETVYVDQQGRVWSSLDERRGG